MEVLKREELGAERKTISLDEAVPLIEKEEDQWKPNTKIGIHQIISIMFDSEELYDQ